MLLLVTLAGCANTPYDTRPFEGVPKPFDTTLTHEGRDRTKEWWPFVR